ARGGQRHGQRDLQLPPGLVELRLAAAVVHRVREREPQPVVGLRGVEAQQLPGHLQRRLLCGAQQRQLDGDHQLARHGARGRVAGAAVVLEVHVVALHHAVAGLGGGRPLRGGGRGGLRGRGRRRGPGGEAVGIGEIREVLAFLRSSLTPNCCSTASRAVVSSMWRKRGWRRASAKASGWKTTS
uniref:Uncharacterized protein n=1 Tax=Jaculus jaculus TaxID=51337 RepID=A0A8C5KTN7_JACJA